MRERLVAAFVGLAVVLLALYAIPRAYLITQEVRTLETRTLERSADLLAVLIPERARNEVVTEEFLAGLLVEAERIEVARSDGTVTAAGPDLAPHPANIVVTRGLSDGTTMTISHSGDFVEARVGEYLVSLAALGLALLAAAVVTALVMARAMSRPFLVLADAAARLGAGNFTSDIPRFRIPEADGIGRALQSSSIALEDMLRREREFASNASHQLRTPLTALRLEIEDLTLRKDTPPELAGELDRALSELDRLDEAVSYLLELARSQRVATGTNVDLAAVAAGAVARWRTAADASGRTLEARLPASLPARVPEGPVQQILDVLVDNALKYGQGTVTVRAGDAGTHLEITVSDSGPRPADNIFHRRVTAGNGEGIGLALARELAGSIGCHLGLDASRRTRFTLKVPAPAPAQAPPVMAEGLRS
jgi:signal transduction histidine kinase